MLFDRSTGSIKAMGPHMPMQWRLPIKPSMMADSSIFNSVNKALLMQIHLALVFPSDFNIPAAIQQTIVRYEQIWLGKTDGYVKIQIFIRRSVEGHCSFDGFGF